MTVFKKIDNLICCHVGNQNDQPEDTVRNELASSDSLEALLVRAKIFWCEQQIKMIREKNKNRIIHRDQDEREKEIAPLERAILHLRVHGTLACDEKGTPYPRQCSVSDVHNGFEKYCGWNSHTLGERLLFGSVFGMLASVIGGGVTYDYLHRDWSGALLGIIPLAVFIIKLRPDAEKFKKQFDDLVAKDRAFHATCKHDEIIPLNDGAVLTFWVEYKIQSVRDAAVGNASSLGTIRAQLVARKQEAADIAAQFEFQLKELAAKDPSRVLCEKAVQKAVAQREQLQQALDDIERQVALINTFLTELGDRVVGKSSAVRRLELFQRLARLEAQAAAEIAEAQRIALQTVCELELRLNATSDAFRMLQVQPAIAVAAHGTEGLPINEQLAVIDAAVAQVVALELSDTAHLLTCVPRDQ